MALKASKTGGRFIKWPPSIVITCNLKVTYLKRRDNRYFQGKVA